MVNLFSDPPPVVHGNWRLLYWDVVKMVITIGHTYCDPLRVSDPSASIVCEHGRLAQSGEREVRKVTTAVRRLVVAIRSQTWTTDTVDRHRDPGVALLFHREFLTGLQKRAQSVPHGYFVKRVYRWVCTVGATNTNLYKEKTNFTHPPKIWKTSEKRSGSGFVEWHRIVRGIDRYGRHGTNHVSTVCYYCLCYLRIVGCPNLSHKSNLSVVHRKK